MEIKFSTDLQTILCYARDAAMRTGSFRALRNSPRRPALIFLS